MSQQPKGVVRRQKFSDYQSRDGVAGGVKREKKGEAMCNNWSINTRKLIETTWAGEP